ncbi:MAG: hypothetical protein AVDCRST_MAG39-2082, partial [uncultured Sphingomonadaceae bacterium]
WQRAPPGAMGTERARARRAISRRRPASPSGRCAFGPKKRPPSSRTTALSPLRRAPARARSAL